MSEIGRMVLNAFMALPMRQKLLAAGVVLYGFLLIYGTLAIAVLALHAV